MTTAEEILAKVRAEGENVLNRYVLQDWKDGGQELAERLAATADAQLVPSDTDPGWILQDGVIHLRLAPKQQQIMVTLNLLGGG